MKRQVLHRVALGKQLTRIVRKFLVATLVFVSTFAMFPNGSFAALSLDAVSGCYGTATLTTNPGVSQFTLASTAKVVVLNIFVSGTTARTGGAPTYGGVTMTQASTTAVGGEGISEMWYLLDPPTGRNSFSIPNSGALGLASTTISFIPQSGYSIALDKTDWATNVTGTTNPGAATTTATGRVGTTTVTTTVNGDALVAHIAGGHLNWNTGTIQGHYVDDGGGAPASTPATVICDADIGALGYGAEYYLQPTAKKITMSWGHAISDDWAINVAAFKEYLPTITLSGKIYTDEGTTQLATAGKTLKVRMGTSTAGFFSTTTIAANGFWQIPNIANTGMFVGMPVHAWIDSDTAFRAFTFTKASSTSNNISNIDLYQNYLIVKHEGNGNGISTSTTIADLGVYDGASNASIRFATSSGNLNVWATTTLYIAPGAIFRPGGAITIHGNGLAASDGNLRLAVGPGQNGVATSSQLVMETNNLTLAGNWFASSTSIFDGGTGTVVLLSTSTATKLIVATSSPFYKLNFGSGSGTGPWTFGANAATTTNSVDINATTAVTAPSTDWTIAAGNCTGLCLNSNNNGTFIHNSGTIIFASTGNMSLAGMTGTNAFNNVIFRGAGTKTFNAAASTTNFTIESTSGAVTAPSTMLTISGDYTNNGTFTHNNGTVYFSSTTAQTLSGTMTNTSAFNNISLIGSGFTAKWITSTTTAEASVRALTVDSTNGILYAGTNGNGKIYRCNTTTLCDAGGDWATSMDVAGTSIFSLTFDSTNNILYAGTSAIPSVVYRCNTTTLCDATADWTTSTSTSASENSLTFDSINNILYAGSSNGVIYRCDTATLCDAGGDWTTSFATTQTNIYSLTFDSTNGILYAGSGSGGIIYRCNTTTLCDAAGDWTTSYDTTESIIYALTFDSTNGILYAGTNPNGIIYRCNTTTLCDAAGDWTTSYDTTESSIFSLTFDSTHGILYAGTNASGLVLGCDTTTLCDAAGDWTTSNDTAGSFIYSLAVDSTHGIVYAGSGSTNGIIYRGAVGKIFSGNASTTDLTINSGSSMTPPALLTVGGNYTQNGRFIASGGMVYFSTTSPATQTLAGTMTGTSAFASTTFIGSGTKTFSTAASSTSAFIVNSGATVVAPALLSLAGTYTQNGTFTHNSGLVYLSGTLQQTLSGTMTGTSAFRDLTVLNTWGTGGAAGKQSIVFSAAASTTGTFTMAASTSAQFASGTATSSFTNIVWNGSSASPIWLRSSNSGTPWGLVSTGTQSVSYVNVKDSYACAGNTITNTNGTDVSGNSCWSFPIPAFVTLSGRIYTDEGTTQLATAGKTLTVVISTSTPGIFATTTIAANGFWQLPSVLNTGIAANTGISAFINGDTTFRAFTFTKASSTSGNITGLDLYKNYLIVKHEATGGTGVTNTDLGQYDRDDNSSIQFTSNAGVLNVNATTSLFIAPGSQFTPGGAVTIHGNGNALSDGNLRLATGLRQDGVATTSILSMGANALTLAGNWFASSTSIFTASGQITTFNSTSTAQKQIVATSTTFDGITFSSSGSNSYTFGSNAATATGAFNIISSGVVVTAPSTNLTIGGGFSSTAGASNSNFIHNSGTLIFNGTGSDQAISMMVSLMNPANNVEFRGSATKSFSSPASTTNFIIASGSGAVTAPSTQLTISGNYTNNGTFSHNGGTVYFDSASAQTLAGTMIGSSAFASTTFLGGGSKTFSNAASTTNFVSYSGSGQVALPVSGLMSISGDYTMNGGGIVQYQTILFDGASQALSGTMNTGVTDFNPMIRFTGSGTKTIANNASTSAIQIDSGVTVVAPALLSIGANNGTSCNYTNNGTFTAGSGTVLFDGTSCSGGNQTLSGNMTGSSAFNNLTITNTSGTGGGAGAQSVNFANAASTTGTFTMAASTSAQFASGTATSSFANLVWNGSSASPIWVRSSTAGTPWGLVSTGTQSVSYVNVKDSYACAGNSITNTNGTDAGGNSCWTIPANITLSGRIYTDEGTTQLTTLGKTLMVRMGTSTAGFFATSTVAANGFWQIPNITNTGVFIGMPVHAWIDGDSTFRAFTFTKTSSISNNITGLDLYKNYVIVKHEGFNGTSTTNADLGVYDGDDNASIRFTSNANVLNVWASSTLYIAPGTTFQPGGAVTLHGNAGGNGDGDLRLATGLRQDGVATTSILSMGANALTLAGNWFASSTSIFTHTGPVTFNSTSTAQKIITATSSPFSSINFNANGGSYTFGANAATTTGDLTIGVGGGSVTAPSTFLSIGGNFGKPSGTFIHNNGTVTFYGSGAQTCCNDVMTGANAFNNVIFRGAGAKSFNYAASTTNFTIESGSGAVTAPSTNLTISGNYTNNGTFSHNGGTVYFSSTTAQTLVGTMTGTSAFASTTFIGGGQKTFANNASTTNFTIDSTASSISGPTLLSISGNFVLNGSNFDMAGKTFLFDGGSQNISGSYLTNANFSDGFFKFLGSGTKTFLNNATTSDFTIGSGVTVVAPPLLTIGTNISSFSSNFTNNGTFTAGSGTVYLANTNGSTIQTLSGTMTGTSAFNNLTILNTNGTGATQSVIFSAAASTTGTFTMAASTSAQFASGTATSSFANLVWNGSSASPIWVRSSTAGTPWGLVSTGTQSVSYVNVKDSYACAGNTITNTSGTDVSGNSCWSFPTPVNLTLSGRIYTDEGTTQLTTAGKTLTVRMGTSTPGFYSTTTIAANGFWQIPNITNTGVFIGMPVHAWIDGDSTFRAFTFTKASSTSGNITGLDLYKDYVIVKMEGYSGTSTTIADLGVYDGASNASIRFSTSSGALNVWATSTLYIAPGTEFKPGGAVTLHGNKGGNGDGDLRLATGLRQDGVASTSMLTMGANALTLAGNWFASSTSIFTQTGTASTTFNSTSTATKLIVATTTAFNNIAFDGAAGLWSFAANAATTSGNFALINTGHAIQFSGTSAGPDNSSFIDLVTINTAAPPENNSFEVPSTGTYIYNPTGGTWTFGASSGIEHNGSAFGATNAPDGTQAAFMQNGTNATVSQWLPLGPGTYTISFYAARRSGQINPIQVSVDGTNIGGTITPVDNNFAQYTTSSFVINSAGGVTVPSTSLSIGGNLSRNNAASFLHNNGTMFFNGVSAQSIANAMTGSNAFNGVEFTGAGTKSFGSNAASTTNFIINSSSGAVTAPSTYLTISGNYTNNATFTHNSGMVYFSSTTAQTIAGTMTGTPSAFANLTFIGGGTKTFANNASTTAAFTINSGATVVAPALLTVGGDYTQNGTFTHNNGKVYASPSSVVTQIGSGLAISGNGYVAIARLLATSTADVAHLDGNNQILRTYRWNGSTWSQVGSSLSVSGVSVPALASMATTSSDVAYLGSSSSGLRTYRWNGSSWSQVGNTLAISGVAWTALAGLNSSDIAFIDGGNESLRTYRFDGTNWSQVGSGLTVAAFNFPALTTISTSTAFSDVAFIDDINDTLRTYRWNGSTWAQVGNGLSIPGTGYPSLATIATSTSGADVVFTSSTTNELRTYRWDGTNWVQVGSTIAITGSSETPALAVIATTTAFSDVAFINDVNDTLRTYRFNSPNTLAGSMTGTNGFNNIEFIFNSAGAPSPTTIFSNNASTTNFTINSGAAVLSPPLLSIAGNYTQNGTFTAGSGTTTFNGTTAQTLSGAMTGTSAFSNLEFNSAGTKTFNANASTTGFTQRATSGNVDFTGKTISISGNFSWSAGLTGNNTTNLLFDGANQAFDTTSGSYNLKFLGSGTKTSGAAGTITATDILVAPGVTLALAGGTGLQIAGNYTQNGTFTAGSGTTTFNGTTAQTLSGAMIGANAFNHLAFTNTSATTTFANSASTTNFYASTSGVHLAFAPGATTSIYGNLVIHGTSGNPVTLFSSTNGSPWYIYASSTTAVTYAKIKDSDACAKSIDASTGGTNIDGGNNSCWFFTAAPLIFAAANQIFTVDDAATAISQIQISDFVTPSITAANDIRVPIATSTTFMRWDTSKTGATFGGTACPNPNAASCKVSTTTLSYEGGGSVLLIPVTTSFAAADTLTFSGLNFMTFATATGALAGFQLWTGGITDQVADATNSKTITIKGYTTGGEHAAAQVTNSIDVSGVNLTNLLLYAFKLALTGGENMSVTNLKVSLSGVSGIAAGDVTNAKLYIDYNANKVVDAGDTQVGGAGAVSISGGTGSIIFSSTFTATSTRNYLLQADIASVGFSDSLTVMLAPSNVTASGVTSLLATTPTSTTPLSSIQHVKVPRGGGEVGSSPPSSTPVGGGGQSGGTVIGNEPGFFAPTATGGTFNQWTTPTNGYASDNAYATAATSWFRQDYGTFGLSVPSTNTITGIEVKLELSGSTAAGTVAVALSWDGGTSTTTVKTSPTLTTADAVITLGGVSDTWGRTWTPADFSNANFKVRLVAQPSGNTVQVDAIQVKVTNIATGGGQGGGGEVLAPHWRNLASIYEAGRDLFITRISLLAFITEKLNTLLALF